MKSIDQRAKADELREKDSKSETETSERQQEGQEQEYVAKGAENISAANMSLNGKWCKKKPRYYFIHIILINIKYSENWTRWILNRNIYHVAKHALKIIKTLLKL